MTGSWQEPEDLLAEVRWETETREEATLLVSLRSPGQAAEWATEDHFFAQRNDTCPGVSTLECLVLLPTLTLRMTVTSFSHVHLPVLFYKVRLNYIASDFFLLQV